MTIPYAYAKSGLAAREEISQVLRRFGCESVGFMDIFEEQAVMLAFKHRGRNVQLKASARGWAAMFLKDNPWSRARKCTRVEHEQKAVEQGLVAINSILRDWVKGQITAVETGILSFEAVFMPYMLTSDGRSLLERVAEQNLLAAPT